MNGLKLYLMKTTANYHKWLTGGNKRCLILRSHYQMVLLFRSLHLEHEKIADMAKKYGVSVPQLCIRYDIQLGMIVLPKTANPEHMKSNADVEFVISDEDMEALKNVEHIKDYGEHGFFPVFGGKM